MKIGNMELPDFCPDCEKVLIKTPSHRIIKEGGPTYSTFHMKCMNCEYETDKIKIRDSYLLKDNKKIKDVTPYKYGIIGKIFGIFN